MTTVLLNLQAVRERVARAAEKSGRSAAAVTLLAVSKTFPSSYIEAAARAGQKDYGESYAQEAIRKIATLAHLELDWHFVGPVQSNKTSPIAEHFSWVHSIDREKIAARLSESRPANLPPLNVCIQVNVSGEGSKSGVAAHEVQRVAAAIVGHPRLRLRGLMAIPEPTPDVALQRQRFALLRSLQEKLIATGYPLDTLSMGMSDDLESAIVEGATIVRVGTAIFGERKPRVRT